MKGFNFEKNLSHQTQAVESTISVFENLSFVQPKGTDKNCVNPAFDFLNGNQYPKNISQIQENNGIEADSLITLLEKIDSDKNFNPGSVIAFGYHFASKNLRELSENLKSFANKKKIDVDFVTRY